jgi:hypothetical protein
MVEAAKAPVEAQTDRRRAGPEERRDGQHLPERGSTALTTGTAPALGCPAPGGGVFASGQGRWLTEHTLTRERRIGHPPLGCRAKGSGAVPGEFESAVMRMQQ